jgi:hypothetical protein
VRHVENRRPHAAEERLELRPHPLAEEGIQVRERFVEQVELGPADQRAAQGHPLLLPPRELSRPACEQPRDPQQIGRLADSPLAFLPGDPPHLQGQSQVPRDGQMGVEREVLEDESNLPLPRTQVIDRSAVQLDRPRGCSVQARDDSQQR